MSKGFWKGVVYSFLGAIPLNLLLILAFNILQRLGIIHTEGNNLIIFFGVYTGVFLVYILAVIFYFKRQSSENMEKLKRDVEEITGRNLVNNQKGFAPFLILVAILVVSGLVVGAYYFAKSQSAKSEVTPSPNPVVTSKTPQSTPLPSPTDEIANWKTYTNSKYRFSFKYPSQWIYEESSDLGLGEDSERRKSGYHILLGDPNVKVSAGGGKTIIAGSVDIHVYNKENYAYYTDNLDEYYKVINKKPTRKTTNVNGLTIEEVHHGSCITSDDCISVIFKKDANVFNFDTWVWVERYKDLETIYQILSTFKFN